MARRIIFTLVVTLTIGAILNIVIAWSCVAVSKTRAFNVRRLGQLRADHYAEDERLAKASGIVPGNRYLAMLFESFGTRLMMIDEDVPGTLQSVRTTQHDAGWPTLSMRAEQSRDRRGQPAIIAGVKMGTLDLVISSALTGTSAPSPVSPALGVALPSINKPASPMMGPAAAVVSQTTNRLLPLRPLWRGFATNTIFYAAVTWMCWILFTMSMRTQRRLRGRCGHCAYPIGVSPVCTECGRKVVVRGRMEPQMNTGSRW